MRTRTTRTRTALAAATLAALPLAAGTLRADPAPRADVARTQSVGESHNGPRWTYFNGKGSQLPYRISCPWSGGWCCVFSAL